MTLFLLIDVYLESLYPNKLISLASWKYNEDYLEGIAAFSKYAVGVLAVLLVFAW